MIEAQVLPLIAALQSRIDQAHFIRIVAERLRVPEEAVRAEVAKRPVLPNTEDMVSTHVPQALVATPIERKVGMLFFYFDEASPQRQRLLELFGADRLAEIQTILVDQAERLRFDFEREVGEHSTAEVIADDLLGNIESFVSKEKLRRRFL